MMPLHYIIPPTNSRTVAITSPIKTQYYFFYYIIFEEFTITVQLISGPQTHYSWYRRKSVNRYFRIYTFDVCRAYTRSYPYYIIIMTTFYRERV